MSLQVVCDGCGETDYASQSYDDVNRPPTWEQVAFTRGKATWWGDLCPLCYAKYKAEHPDEEDE